MRKIREILRQRKDEGLAHRLIAASVKSSSSTVGQCLERFEASGLSWPLPAEVSDEELEARLYPKPALKPGEERAAPDYQHVYRELRRKGVTLQLLWEEYKQAHPRDGYQYSQFCDLYRRWHQPLDVVMRQTHKAGEKVFVDWSGDGIKIVDGTTGEVWEAPLFVGVLGASGYAFAAAAPDRQSHHWIRCHIEMYEFFGGVPKVTTPDNEKTGVTTACYYDPELNKTYDDLAKHYGTVIIPTRPGKPRDKALVENAVRLVQQWILARLRNHTFFSVDEANEAISEKLEEYNLRKFQRLETNRRELYETLDKPALMALPTQRYEYAQWSSPKVNIDYHVDVDKHLYSVPYQLVGERLEARRTATTIELILRGKRVAVHQRSYVAGGRTTNAEHMPLSHRAHLEWSPSRIIGWAQKSGEQVAKLAEQILASKPHPELGYRACLGLLRLGERYGAARLDAACARAIALGAPSYKTVDNILKRGQDRQMQIEVVDAEGVGKMPDHENIRGADYYN